MDGYYSTGILIGSTWGWGRWVEGSVVQDVFWHTACEFDARMCGDTEAFLVRIHEKYIVTLVSVVLLVGVCFLAYSNGSNDIFRGVETLFGSDTTSYRTALAWGTVATIAGSVCSFFVADSLAIHFSGKGLVPMDVAGSPLFLQAVVFGAGLWVWVATVSYFQVSTNSS